MTTRKPTGWYRTAAVLAAALAASVAGCTGSKGHPAVDTGFVSRANAICATAVSRHDGHAVPVRDFDPLHPKAQDLPAIGGYFAKYGAAGATAAQLDKLAAPSKQQANWTTLRALVDEVAANAGRQITAAERSDVTGFEKTVTTARSLAERIDQVGPMVGFNSGSPCRQVFG